MGVVCSGPRIHLRTPSLSVVYRVERVSADGLGPICCTRSQTVHIRKQDFVRIWPRKFNLKLKKKSAAYMHVCISVCMHVLYACMYICRFEYIFTRVSVCCERMRVCMCASVFVLLLYTYVCMKFMYVSQHASLYVCTDACMYARIKLKTTRLWSCKCTYVFKCECM